MRPTRQEFSPWMNLKPAFCLEPLPTLPGDIPMAFLDSALSPTEESEPSGISSWRLYRRFQACPRHHELALIKTKFVQIEFDKLQLDDTIHPSSSSIKEIRSAPSFIGRHVWAFWLREISVCNHGWPACTPASNDTSGGLDSGGRGFAHPPPLLFSRYRV